MAGVGLENRPSVAEEVNATEPLSAPVTPDVSQVAPDLETIQLAMNSEVLSVLSGTLAASGAEVQSELLLGSDPFDLSYGILNVGTIKFYKTDQFGKDMLTVNLDVDKESHKEKSGFYDMAASVEKLEGGGVEVTFSDVNNGSKTLSFTVVDRNSLKIKVDPQKDGSTVVLLTSSYQLDSDQRLVLNDSAQDLKKGTVVTEQLSFSLLPKELRTGSDVTQATSSIVTNPPGWREGDSDPIIKSVSIGAPSKRE